MRPFADVPIAPRGAPHAEAVVYEQLDPGGSRVGEQVAAVCLGLAEHLRDAGQQALCAGTHVHGPDRKPQCVDADHRSNSRNQAAHAAAAVIGQVVFMAAVPRRSSIWMSTGAGGDVVCAIDTGKNCGMLAAVLAGKVVGPGG